MNYKTTGRGEIRDQCFYFLPSFSVLLRWHYYLGIVSVQIKYQSENMSVASSHVQPILPWVSQQP